MVLLCYGTFIEVHSNFTLEFIKMCVTTCKPTSEVESNQPQTRFSFLEVGVWCLVSSIDQQFEECK